MTARVAVPREFEPTASVTVKVTVRSVVSGRSLELSYLTRRKASWASATVTVWPAFAVRTTKPTAVVSRSNLAARDVESVTDKISWAETSPPVISAEAETTSCETSASETVRLESTKMDVSEPAVPKAAAASEKLALPALTTMIGVSLVAD